jgi:hypothetical protein
VYRRPAGALQDLFAATEAIRDNQGVLRRIPHRWKQDSFCYSL